MNTLGSVALLALASATFVAGCGCDPGNNSQRAPVTFTPSSSESVRTPGTCGDPAFGPSDTFTLELLGETDVAPPFTDVKISMRANVIAGEATPLNVANATGSTVTSGQSSDNAIQFSFSNGSNAYELDASPIDSVIVTVSALPTADGQPLSVELYISFEDGRVLDQSYAAPVQTVMTACKQ